MIYNEAYSMWFQAGSGKRKNFTTLSKVGRETRLDLELTSEALNRTCFLHPPPPPRKDSIVNSSKTKQKGLLSECTKICLAIVSSNIYFFHAIIAIIAIDAIDAPWCPRRPARVDPHNVIISPKREM